MSTNSFKELLESTVDLPETLKKEIEKEFDNSVENYLKEALNYNVNKPLELFVNDPNFKRLVLAWDRNNPEVTRAQLLRSFPAAFKDLQGNTIAEPLVDFFMDILKALVSDTALMQRVIRNMQQDQKEEGSVETSGQETVETSALKENYDAFKFMRIIIENSEEYLKKEEFVLNSGYEFAFFADETLMPVDKDKAKYKVFVKTITVDTSSSATKEPSTPEASSETDSESSENLNAEFSFVAKKMVALEWKPEYGGVGVDEVSSNNEKFETDEDEMETEEEVPEEFVDKVNEYLDYTVSEFIKENKLAIENGIKVELAESIINGIKNVLMEHDLDLDNNTKVQSLEEKLKVNEEAINNLYEKNVELFKENKKLRKMLFEQKTNIIANNILTENNLSDVEKQKIEKLFSLVNFDGSESDEVIAEKYKEVVNTVLTETPKKKNNNEKTLMEVAGVEIVKNKNIEENSKELKDIDIITKVLKNLN